MTQNGSDSDFVDLGNEQILFGTKNLGAQYPSDIGLYYSYGQLVGHDASYGFSNNLWDSVDDSLSNELDVAYLESYGVYRMPYDFELEWLLNHTTKTFITSSPVNYFVFTSQLNGQSIIIPAGGYVANNNTRNKGIACFIMSRTSRDSNAEFRLNAAYVNNAISANINAITKYYGINIRPIKTR